MAIQFAKSCARVPLACEFLWNTGKVNTGGRVTMHTDGNLVSYDSAGKALWSTSAHNRPGATLGMRDDGNIAIYPGTSCATVSTAR
ncbi:MAG: hypothetical protein QM778_07330 [Myxococcales bacterium]